MRTSWCECGRAWARGPFCLLLVCLRNSITLQEEEYEEGDEYEDEDELLEEEMGSSSERVIPVQGSEDEQPGPSSAQQGRRGMYA